MKLIFTLPVVAMLSACCLPPSSGAPVPPVAYNDDDDDRIDPIAAGKQKALNDRMGGPLYVDDSNMWDKP